MSRQVIKYIPMVNRTPVAKMTISRFYMQDQDGIDILQSAVESQLLGFPVIGIYEVKAWDRIDLISWKLYGTTDYWWLLLLYNNWLDPENLPDTLNYFDGAMIKIALASKGTYRVIQMPDGR